MAAVETFNNRVFASLRTIIHAAKLRKKSHMTKLSVENSCKFMDFAYFCSIMMRKLLLGLTLLIASVAPLRGVGEVTGLRPVSLTWSLEAGSSTLADTYLTPLKYHGLHLGVGYDRWQSMRFCPERWADALRFRFLFDRALNPAGNSTMYGAGIAAGWSMVRVFDLGCGFRVGVGGAADLDVGALLLQHNSNNPVQARASVTVGPEVGAYWACRRLIGAGFSMRSPLIGAFFSPDYGELYYEISLGNHGGLVHCAWPGAFRRLQADFYVDIRPSATALRIGYRTDLLSFRANGITGR